LVITH